MSPRNIILIIRSETVCLVILFYLIHFSYRYWENAEKKNFLKMCFWCLGHVLFDIITVCTVNHLDTVPVWINDLMHIIFYEFAILFCYEFFCYVIGNVFSRKTAAKIVRWSALVPILYPLTLQLFQIDYLHGTGTNYSYGSSVFLGYGTAMTFFLVSFVLVLLGQRIDPAARRVLLPTLFLTLAVIITQIFIPELLFTGSAMTLIVLSMFFAIENPLKKYKQQAYFDIETGVRNRNSYEADLQYLTDEYIARGEHPNLVYVICDLNNLKLTNDRHGHAAGDELLRKTAHLLTVQMRRAHRVYRIGGDEFAALYMNKRLSVIEQEIESVRQECKNIRTSFGGSVSLALGYAVLKENDTIEDMVYAADEMMYEDKQRAKETAG